MRSMQKNAPSPIVRWPGGKRRHLKLLLPLIRPNVCYVEVFAGGLAVLLAKERGPVEVVNDTNRDLVALYRCAQFHLEALIKETEWQLAARVNFKDFPENRGLTDLQRATRFLVSNLTSFAGDGKSFGVSKTSGGGVALNRQRIVDRLTALRERMDRVVVECLDWKRCVALYDSEDTFFFFDPPYLHAKINAYAGWNEEQMCELRDVLRTIKGKWMVTVDGSDFCKKLFSEWHVREIETRNRTVNHRLVAGAKFSELIITPAE